MPSCVRKLRIITCGERLVTRKISGLLWFILHNGRPFVKLKSVEKYFNDTPRWAKGWSIYKQIELNTKLHYIVINKLFVLVKQLNLPPSFMASPIYIKVLWSSGKAQ